MGAEILRLLISTTIATSSALVLIGLLRKPLRIAVGARVAYWLWLLYPAMLAAVLLPAPPAHLLTQANILPGTVNSAITAVTAGHPASTDSLLTNLALAIWSIGACGMSLWMFMRQRSFARAHGVLTRDADGIYRGDVAVPMLVGAWHSKIIVPTDFEARYSLHERELVLAHERAHAARHDVAVNAIAAAALCVSWFNPLTYRALAWLRMDQELACDAQVLLQRGNARRHYADALLKTQLAAESAWRLSLGCNWQSIHPLKERVAMLKRPLPARTRRLAGLAFVAAFTGVLTYATWAGQPAIAAGPPILVDYDIRITNLPGRELREVKTAYLVNSGETIKDEHDRLPLLKLPLPKEGSLRIGCTPYLADIPGRTTDWSAQKARGNPIPAAGQILLDCPIHHDGAIVHTPAVIANDGAVAIIEVAETKSSYQYRLEVTASTSPEKIAAAKIAGAKFIHDQTKSGK